MSHSNYGRPKLGAWVNVKVKVNSYKALSYWVLQNEGAENNEPCIKIEKHEIAGHEKLQGK